jgi:bacteriocin resistance YdeI/OmpD-like protein/uncharacterized protein DUF1905
METASQEETQMGQSNFKARIELDGKTATGICVPDELVEALGGGKRPKVRATVAGYSYRTSVGRMRGEFKFPVSAAVREAAGVAAGDEVDVSLELDTKPRELNLPEELAKALGREPAAKQAFEQLSYSKRKRHILAVEGAKTEETRQRRVAKTLEELRG